MTELWLLPLLAGLGLTAVSGPFGSMLVWQRMAFFGDALAHASMLGVGIGLLFQWSPLPGATLGTVLFALVLWRAEQNRTLALDTWLGVLSHGSLATGLLLLYGYAPAGVNVSGLLIGDILGVTAMDIGLLAVFALAALLWFRWRWDGLMLAILSPDLAQAEGVPLRRLRAEFMALLALLVALALQWVGVLLISSLLLIPAAAARPWSRSAEHMAAGASAIGMTAVSLGILLSWHLDWPAGPAMVVSALGLFALSWGSRQLLLARPGG